MGIISDKLKAMSKEQAVRNGWTDRTKLKTKTRSQLEIEARLEKRRAFEDSCADGNKAREAVGDLNEFKKFVKDVVYRNVSRSESNYTPNVFCATDGLFRLAITMPTRNIVNEISKGTIIRELEEKYPIKVSVLRNCYEDMAVTAGTPLVEFVLKISAR